MFVRGNSFDQNCHNSIKKNKSCIGKQDKTISEPGMQIRYAGPDSSAGCGSNQNMMSGLKPMPLSGFNPSFTGGESGMQIRYAGPDSTLGCHLG